MDQVRKALVWLKKYHFWVLCGVVALFGPLFWKLGAGALDKQFVENKSKIEGAKSTVSSVMSDSFHPNPGIAERQTEQTNLLAADVAKIWEQLYARQSENVLKWPAVLTKRFHEAVEKLPFGGEISDELRENYQNYITNHFKKLPEKIGARPIDESTAAGMSGGFSEFGGGMAMSAPGEMEDDGNYICEWLPADQAAVRAELEFPQIPSSLRVWCTQENLWVYHTMLDVIKNTNEAAHATRRSNAAVRGIYALQVGQPAAEFSRTPGRIYKLPSAAAGGEGAGFTDEFAPPTEPAEGGEFSEGSEFTSGLADGSTGEMAPEQEAAHLLRKRYLGEDGKPITTAPVMSGGAAADPTAPPDAAADSATPTVDMTPYGKEYKRLPIRMVLEMDQRYLPRLIAECAIRPLQIEVQEVRINAKDLLSGAGGMGGGFSEFSGGMGGAANLIPDLTGLQEFNPHPEIVTVAIQGVIYIFTKPNMELLKPSETATDGGSVAAVQ